MRYFSSLFFLTSLGVGLTSFPLHFPVELHQGEVSASFGVESRRIKTGGHEAAIGLVAAGCVDSPRQVSQVAPKMDGSRVVYNHEEAGVEEWYLRDDRGIEQGFTFAQAPQGCAAPSLRLEMFAEGGLIPTLDSSKNSISFRDAQGIERLTYGELYAFDHTGRKLPATMEVEGARLALVVNTTDAEYPIVVDPLVAKPKQTLRGISLNPLYGNSVAIYGDLVAVGIPDDGDSGADAGAVALYRTFDEGSTWSFQKKIYPSNTAGSRCGSAVAMEGSTLLIGCPGGETNPGLPVQVWNVSTTAESKPSSEFSVSSEGGSHWGKKIVLSGNFAAIVFVKGKETSASSISLYHYSGNGWEEIESPKIFTSNDIFITIKGGVFAYAYDSSSDQKWKVGIWEIQGKGVSNSSALSLNHPNNLALPIGGLVTNGEQIFISNENISNSTGIHIIEKSNGQWGNPSLQIKPPPNSNYLAFGDGLAVNNNRLFVSASTKNQKREILGYQFDMDQHKWVKDDESFPIPISGTTPVRPSLAMVDGRLVVGDTSGKSSTG